MDDLISRSALLEVIGKLKFQVNVSEEVGHNRPFLDIANVLSCIDEQPTAYDVEKVVAELEEEYRNAQMEYTLGKYNQDNYIGNKIIENYRQDMNEGKCFAYDTAIYIVKAGGVE